MQEIEKADLEKLQEGFVPVWAPEASKKGKQDTSKDQPSDAGHGLPGNPLGAVVDSQLEVGEKNPTPLSRRSIVSTKPL